jgi:NADH pyrophosphatase NudC (nudix superfamily)
MMKTVKKIYRQHWKLMSLRPESHFASVFDYCSTKTNFQCFQGNPLNRLNLHRKSFDNFIEHSQARFLPLKQLKILFDQDTKRPIWLTYQDLQALNNENHFDLNQCDLVLLGLGSRLIADRPTTSTKVNIEEAQPIDSKLLSQYLLTSEPTSDDYIYFSLSVPLISADPTSGTYMELRPLLPQMYVVDAAICGQARALLEWHTTSKYCGKCASSTISLEGGTRRKCQQCKHTFYPRTDPVAITLVIHADKQRLLLGRKAVFPPNLYTCLAGFIEPGESIVEACAREVWEESGIVIDTNSTNIFDTQPWPFLGGQLMIGCHAYALDDIVTLHDSELEDCRWFTRDEIRDMIERAKQTNLDRNDHGLRIPPPVAIAHQMIQHWYSMLN